jgi:hypothetical protein
MRALVIALLCFAQVALAGPHQVLVLKSEGTADTSSRTNVDTHVLRIAKNVDGKVEAGDITFTEAAAVVGCNPSDAQCKDEVLSTLGVDEIVATTVTSTPTGLNVTVRRIGKNGPPKAAQTTIPAGKAPDARLNADIGPLFGLTAPAPPPETKPVEPVKPPPAPVTTAPANPPPPRLEDHSTAPMNDVTAAPNGEVAPPPIEGKPPSRRKQKILMGVGGGFLLLSFVMWMSASSVQGDIDDKPEPVSPTDIQELRDLEKKGDDIAGAGNLFFLVGAGLTGIGAYYYWKAGKQSSTQARITPTAYPGGGGVTLTIGGMP